MLPPDRLAAGPLVLRRWTDADASALSAAVLDSVHHLRPWMPWAADEPIEPAERLALIAHWQRSWDDGAEHVYGMWAEGTVVGGCGLHDRLKGPGLEIGYWVHAGHVRRGYATAAAAALTTAAFELAQVDFVEIHHDKANVASGRVPATLGFTRIGEEPRPRLAPAETGTTVLWRMRRQAWQARERPRPGP